MKKAVSNPVITRVFRSHSGKTGLFLALVLVIFSLIGPLIVRHDAYKLDMTAKLKPPGAEHFFGTDQYGRDQFARLVIGARRSLGAAILVLAGTLVVSLTIGVVAGMTGGVIDVLFMRMVDIILAVPSLVIALAIVGVLGPGFINLLIALVSASWAYFARLARGIVLMIRHRPYVLAARLAGVSTVKIIIGHVLPETIANLLAVATLRLGGIIISLAGLSFLGLGAQPPDAEWGSMLAESRIYFYHAPWLLIGPGLAILLTVASANLIGDTVRDAIEIREKL
jgi:ABC-type dipeptide/oligopeptide/nickel transport system permease subunit